METAVQQRAVRRLLQALLALLILLIIGTTGYYFLEGMTVVDSLYMTVITVSTVGFGEIDRLEPAGRIFTMVLIGFGGGIAAYSVGSAAEFFLSGEWQIYLERQRWKRVREKLSNHTIVCGYGRMGRHVVDELRAQGLSFVIIEKDEDKVHELNLNGFPAIHGDASHETMLHAAGIERAHSLVAVANSDAANVFIVLTARSMAPDLLIVARSNEDESEAKLLRAGANRVILPYRISGRRMVTLLVRPEVSDFLDEVMHTSELELLLDQVTISSGSSLVGKTLAESTLRSEFGVTVLACRFPNHHITTSPSADTILVANLQLIVLGTPVQLLRLQEAALGNVTHTSHLRRVTHERRPNA